MVPIWIVIQEPPIWMKRGEVIRSHRHIKASNGISPKCYLCNKMLIFYNVEEDWFEVVVYKNN